MALFGFLTRKSNPPPKFSVQNLEIGRGEEALSREAAITIEVTTPPKNGDILSRWLGQINSGLRSAFGHPNSDFVISQGQEHTIVIPLKDLARHLNLEELGIDSANIRCEFLSHGGRREISFDLQGPNGQPLDQSITRQAVSLLKGSSFFRHAEVIECSGGKVSVLSFDINRIVNSFIEIDQERYAGDFTKHLERLCSGNFTEAVAPNQKRGDLTFAKRSEASVGRQLGSKLRSLAEGALGWISAKGPSPLHALSTPAVPQVPAEPIIAEQAASPREPVSAVPPPPAIVPRQEEPKAIEQLTSREGQSDLPQQQGWLRRTSSSISGWCKYRGAENTEAGRAVDVEDNVAPVEIAMHEVHSTVAHGLMSAADFGVRLALFPILTLRGIHPYPGQD